MTDKEKSDSQGKSKPKSQARASKTPARKAPAKATGTRAKSTTTKKASETAAAAKETKATTARPRTRRTTKPKKVAEATAELEAAATAEAQTVSERTVKAVAEKVTSAPPEPTPAQDDAGAAALAEWAAAEEPRRMAVRSRGQTHGMKRETPVQPKPSAKDELLDIPAWPELSDEPITPPAPPTVVPETPARAERPASPPAPRSRTADNTASDRQKAPGGQRPRREDRRPQRAEAPAPRREEKAPEPEETDSPTRVRPESAPRVEPAVPAAEGTPEEQPPRRRRRRRRRGRHRNQEQQAEALEGESLSDEAEPGRPAPGRPDRQDRVAPQDRATPQDRVAPRGRPAPAPRPAPPIEPAEDEETELVIPEIWDADLEEEETEVLAPPDEKNGRLMLINVAEGEECRIAILHQKRLEELFIERASAESHVGNIYKGRVTNVEPSIQAAFVDFGLPKNGFLHISDLQPQYFPGGMKTVEEVGRKTPRRDRPPIQKCLRRGQEIIVQIIKEGIGTKGPTLTTYISIPGRYLVMMPGMNRLGVSRRIEDDDARRKMRSILDELHLPKEMGFILRTAGLDRNKRELQQDLLYLQRLWKVVARRIKAERGPCELYRESDLVIRTIRDVFSSDFAKILVDDPRTADKVRDFLAIAMPRSSAPVELYTGHRPLFHEYKLEQEIERINSRYVPLSSGGSLVIESTEALVAIDVNSGKYREHDDAEETAYRINIEAAEEIARQLRLRDLGGLILCDFIDMRAEKHRRGVERALREALKKHKERAKCLRMSQFGIIEMTRQRMRPSIKRSIYQDCSHCRGTGLIKNTESMTLDIMRLLRLASHHDQVDTVEVRVSPEVGFQLQNRKRAAIFSLEKETGRHVIIRADENLGPDQYSFECLDQRGGVIRMDDLPDRARSMPEPRSKRRSGNGSEGRADNGRETLEDVFD